MNLAFPAIWLRDNCPCPECRDPRNDQKLFGITDLESEGGDRRSRRPHRDLQRRPHQPVRPRLAGRPHPGRHRLRRQDRGRQVPLGRDRLCPRDFWRRFLVRPLPAGQRSDAGCASASAPARGVPVEPGTVLEVAGAFGFVRETNYGQLFDVRVEATRTTSPSPGCRSPRTPTTPTATRCRRCSCCTAWPTRPRAATPGWWTASGAALAAARARIPTASTC